MKRVIFSFIVIGIFVFCVVKSISAQTGNPITVFPAIQEKLIRPGIKTRMQVQFKNSGKEQIFGKIKVADFTVNDKEGTPILIEDSTSRPKYSAAAWVTPSADQVTIGANDFVSIDLMVNPPQNISTCGRYALVYLELSPSFVPGTTTARDSATAITTKVGALLNFIVEGKTCVKNLQVSAFTLPSFLEYGPIAVTFDLQNTGDVHVTPQGVVMLANIFNQTTAQQSVAQKNIFPESAKTYTESLGSKWMIGRYKVSLLISREGQEPLLVSKYMWVFPWRVAIFIALALILIIVAGRSFYTRTLQKEGVLEKEIQREKAEIEALKEEMRKRE